MLYSIRPTWHIIFLPLLEIVLPAAPLRPECTCIEHYAWSIYAWTFVCIPGCTCAHAHNDVIKHFPPYWPFARGFHWSPVNSTHKGQWRGALTFSLICAWTNSWANNGDVGDLRRHCAHYDIIVMSQRGRTNTLGRLSVFCIVLFWFFKIILLSLLLFSFNISHDIIFIGIMAAQNKSN